MNRTKGDDLTHRAWEAIQRCLSDVPFCSIRSHSLKSERLPSEVDGLVKIRVEKKVFNILFEVKSSGQPRIARSSINQLLRSSTHFANAYLIFAAPFITEETASLLKSEGIGYVDFAGNCRLCFNGVYISKQGRLNRFVQKRDLRSLYSPKAERVLRALMLEPRTAWKIRPLAAKAKVSIGQVSNVRNLLAAREWLSDGLAGFTLKEPERLLLEWSSVYKNRPKRASEYYSMSSIPELEEQIAGAAAAMQLGMLTGFSAASRFAPAVRYNRVTAYTLKPAEEVASKLGWKKSN